MRLIILYGLPGVGKMTIGFALERLTGWPLVHSHMISEPIRQIIPPGDPRLCRLCRAWQRTLIARAIEGGLPGLIITMFGSQPGIYPHVRRIVTKVESSGGQVDFVNVRCEWKELLRRIRHPARRRYQWKLTTEAALIEHAARQYFRGLPSHPSLVVENTQLSPTVCADYIVERLHLSLRATVGAPLIGAAAERIGRDFFEHVFRVKST